MRLTLTWLARYRRGLQPAVDGIATSAEGNGQAGRYFVPGRLPCGECPLCRRALVGACLARRQVIPLGDALAVDQLELPDRFLTPLDEPEGLPPLADDTAVTAGLVASALSALAAVGAAPGDQALWLGGEAIAHLGTALALSRGLRSAEISGPEPGAVLPLAVVPSEPSASHGRSQQLLFVTTADAPTLARALALAEPGSAVVLLAEGALPLPGELVLPADSRILLQGGYHPDLIPEALAALRRGDVDATTVRRLVDVQQI